MWMDPPLRTPNLRFSPPSSQCERSENTASGSPLGGCVGVQHSGALHPCPNRVHAGHHGLFFHTTPAPLDALVDAKHQNAPLRSLCFFFSLSLFYVSLSSSPGFPPFLSFAPSPGLPFSCDCLIALSPEQSGAVYFTWCLDARVPLKVNKRCDMQKGKKGSCQHPGLQQRLMSATPQE